MKQKLIKEYKKACEKIGNYEKIGDGEITIGSPKQIAWAEKIKKNIIDNLLGIDREMPEFNMTEEEWKTRINYVKKRTNIVQNKIDYEVVIDLIAKKSSAIWYIDKRNMDSVTLFLMIADEIEDPEDI